MRNLFQRVTGGLPKKEASLPAIPPEQERLAALRRYNILDTLPEPVFDDLTKLAAHLCNMPVSLIVLVDEQRLWFKSRVGVELSECARAHLPCEEAILTADLLLVDDLKREERFKDSPLVTQSPHLRFYAGAPLRTTDGFNIGTLCVADHRKRRLSEQQREALRILAHQVTAQLELRRHLVELERSLSEHRQTQDALKNSEVFYQTLVESLPQNILRKDLQGRFVFANQKFCATLGKKPEEVLGKMDRDFFPAHLADKYHEDDLRVMTTREAIDTVEANQTPAGDLIYVHVIKTPLYDANGNVVGIQGIFWDETGRRKTEEALAYERDLLRGLLENIPDRIYFKDVKSRFLRVSSSMAKRLGLKESHDVVGKTDFDFYPKTLADEFYADEQRIVHTGQPLINKLERIVDRDGRESWASVTKVPIYTKKGTVTGIIGISRDVTKLKEAEAALEQARDTALEHARVKSEFLANMSHEIRTPLNAVIGMTDLLMDTPLDEEQREFAETIRHGAGTLLAVINDILDFSKIEAGKLSIETIDFDLREVIETTAEMLAQRAQSKGVELIHSIEPDLPVQLRGDPQRIRQVLTNLTSNAVKFTERGEVVLRVTRVEETPERLKFRVSVQDTGIGIPPKAMPLIFRAFTQADGSTTRKYGGTGLGLAISKQLVEMMGGELGVESKPGVGSTFWFELSFAKQPPAQTTPPPDLHEARVLIVDDNTTSRLALRNQLARWRLSSGEAAEAAEALIQLRAAVTEKRPYQVVIVDMQMPGMDGLTLARAIKADPALTATRVLILTPFGQRLDHDLMNEAGINQCLIKPMRQSRLLDALMGQEPVPSPVEALPQTPNAPAPRREVPPLKILLAEDNAVNQKLALRQLAKLGYSAHPVGNGLEVLQEVEKSPYDVILMDCQMPELDGYEVTRRLRQFEKRNSRSRVSAYIIAVTAHALEGDRERCLSAGMNDYITKPLHIAQLESALDRAVRRRPAAPLSAPVLDPVTLNSLKELREPGLPDPLQELAALFATESSACVERLKQGLAGHDSALASRAAHSLKGSSSNLGAHRLASLSAGLEKAGKESAWEQITAQIGELETELARVQAALAEEIHKP